MEVILSDVSLLEKKIINSVIERNNVVMLREHERIESLKEGLVFLRKFLITTTDDETSCRICRWSIDPKEMMYCKRCDMIICIKCLQSICNSKNYEICHWCYKLMEFNKMYKWYHQFKTISLRQLHFVGNNLVSAKGEEMMNEEICQELQSENLSHEESFNESGKILLKISYDKMKEILRIYIFNIKYNKNKHWNMIVALLPDVDNSTKIKFNLKEGDKNLLDKYIEYHVAQHQIYSTSVYIEFCTKLRLGKKCSYSTEIHFATIENNIEDWYPLEKTLCPKSQYPIRLEVVLSQQENELILTAKSLFGIKSSKSTKYKISVMVDGICLKSQKELLGRKWMTFNDKYELDIKTETISFEIVKIKTSRTIISKDELHLTKPLKPNQTPIEHKPTESLLAALAQSDSIRLLLFLNY